MWTGSSDGLVNALLSHAMLACSGVGSTTQAAGAGGGGGFSLPGLGLGLAEFVGSITALLVLGLAVAFVLVLAARPRPRALEPVPLGARISPDGHYWWDGSAWRPVR